MIGSPKPKIPAGVWALGLVSMFMDISSEMIHALLPVFLVTQLGASLSTVGLIEGIGEGTASITKLFSGWLSDRVGNRKWLAVLGYGLGTLSKPFFAIAPSSSFVLGARFADRVGKGIRGAPRDALVADLTAPEIRGAAFGLRQSLDTVGAFVGPLIGLALMALYKDAFRLVFSVAVIPGVIAVLILIFLVREPESKSARTDRHRPKISWKDLRLLGRPFWGVVAVGSILTLARFSEAFLVLRAQGNGLAVALTPLVLILMNVVYSVTAYPMGILSDRLNRYQILMLGFGVLFFADFALGAARGVGWVWVGIALWGLHMGLTQGILAAMVADTAPKILKGTAFGFFNLITGVAILCSSLAAGALWQFAGPSTTFFAGGLLTLVGALISIPIAISRSKSGQETS